MPVAPASTLIRLMFCHDKIIFPKYLNENRSLYLSLVTVGVCSSFFVHRNEELDCESKGLHSHHPRNCFYYLRDYDNDELKQLLQKNNAEFEQGKAPGGDSKCKLPEETDEGKT